MSKNSELLSISAALIFSLFFLGVSHAVQIEGKRQHAPTMGVGKKKGPAESPTKQVAKTGDPCTEGGKGRTGALDKKHCPRDSGDLSTEVTLRTSTTMLR